MPLDAKDSAGNVLPRYLCHKEVQAIKIKDLWWNPGTHMYEIRPEDPAFARIDVQRSYVDKHGPKAGGYFVVYADGYQSYSPASAFEDGYKPVQA